MISQETTDYVKYLYEIIFHENISISKEFTTFVEGNPHPLRIKVEDKILSRNIDISKIENNTLSNEEFALVELDNFLSYYIERYG